MGRSDKLGVGVPLHCSGMCKHCHFNHPGAFTLSSLLTFSSLLSEVMFPMTTVAWEWSDQQSWATKMTSTTLTGSEWCWPTGSDQTHWSVWLLPLFLLQFLSLSVFFLFFFCFSPHPIPKAKSGWAIQILDMASWREQEKYKLLDPVHWQWRAEKYCFWCFISVFETGENGKEIPLEQWHLLSDDTAVIKHHPLKKMFFYHDTVGTVYFALCFFFVCVWLKLFPK